MTYHSFISPPNQLEVDKLKDIEELRRSEKEGILNLKKDTKIIEIGLGDLIQYYSFLPSSNKILENVDFVFIYSSANNKNAFNKDKLIWKDFKTYQEEFYKLVEKEKT